MIKCICYECGKETFFIVLPVKSNGPLIRFRCAKCRGMIDVKRDIEGRFIEGVVFQSSNDFYPFWGKHYCWDCISRLEDIYP